MSSNAGISPGHVVTTAPNPPPAPPPFVPGQPLFNIVTTAVPYQALAGDFVLTTSNSVTTPVAPSAGSYFAVKNVGALPVAIVGTVDGSVSYVIHPSLTPAGQESVWFVWNATAATWEIVSDFDPTLPLAVDVVAGAAYNFALTDANVRLKSFTNVGAKTATVLSEATVGWKTGTVLRLLNFGAAGVAGALSVVSGAGVTIFTPDTLIAYGIYSQLQLTYLGANIWVLSGNTLLATPDRWTWANAAARMAQVVTAADIGFRGTQTDLATKFELLGVGPTRWGLVPWPDIGPMRAAYGSNANASFQGAGLNFAIVNGTPVSRAALQGNVALQLCRTGHATTAVPGASSQIRGSGGGASAGSIFNGVRTRTQITLAIVSANMRWFAGLGVLQGFPLNTNPNVIQNAMGIGRNNQANLQFYHNDLVGLATEIDLGAAFPAVTLDSAYELILYAPNGAASWTYNVRNMTTNVEISGTVTTNIPNDPTSFITFQYYLTNNTDAVAVEQDFGSCEAWQLTR